MYITIKGIKIKNSVKIGRVSDVQKKRKGGVKLKNKLKNKLLQFKDVLKTFNNSQEQFFFSQKRGSIAIEGAICSTAVVGFLGVMFNFFQYYNQTLLAVRLTDDLGMSVYNGRNTTPAFLQGLLNEIMTMNGVKGSSASLYIRFVQGGILRGYNYNGGCAGPNYGAAADGAFISSLGGIGSLGNHYLSGFNHVAALAQVAVCLPPPSLYLDWGKLGNGIMTSQLSAAMMLVIPAPPKNNKNNPCFFHLGKGSDHIQKPC